jgi:hypothetical protein
VNSSTFIQHQLDNKNKVEQKKLSKDLRCHHFGFGTDDLKSNLTTINREDFKEQPLGLAQAGSTDYLRENHFSIADVTDKYNIYQTTYNNSIGVPKEVKVRQKLDNNSFQTTYLLKVDEKPDFLTESRAKYFFFKL